MTDHFDDKFYHILNPDSGDYFSLPAVYCLIDSTFVLVITILEASALLDAARSYIMAHQDAVTLYTHGDRRDASTSACPPVFKTFKFLSIHRGWQVFAGLLKKKCFFPWKNRPGTNSICHVKK
jgi:hypothetical protein